MRQLLEAQPDLLTPGSTRGEMLDDVCTDEDALRLLMDGGRRVFGDSEVWSTTLPTGLREVGVRSVSAVTYDGATSYRSSSMYGDGIVEAFLDPGTFMSMVRLGTKATVAEAWLDLRISHGTDGVHVRAWSDKRFLPSLAVRMTMVDIARRRLYVR